MTSPKVFISHASEDKDRFVIEFAQRLRSKNIDAWLDKWEIQPGDSLVAKLFDEGIATAQAVIIIISQYSVVKPWVRKELDESVVRQVAEGTRLIPIVIDDSEVPAPLRSTLWVKIKDITNYDSEFNRIVQAIYGHSEKPPLGPAPAYALSDMSISGLSRIDTIVLKALCEKAISINHVLVMVDSIKDDLQVKGIDQTALDESIEILTHGDYITSSSPRLRHVTITTNGFHEYLRIFYSGYDDTVIKVAALLVNEGVFSVDELARQIGCAPLITQHILDVFEGQKILKQRRFLGAANEAFDLSPRLSRWLSEKSR